MITERCRMSVTDTVLVFLAAFVLVSTVMAPNTPLQTVIVSAGPSPNAAYAVPIDHRDLPSIRNRLESYGEMTDHPLMGTNRWIAEASRYYGNAAESLWQTHQSFSANPTGTTVQQVSHIASIEHSAAPHGPSARSWNRIAAEAEARIDQMKRHQSVQLQSLRPAAVKLGAVVNVYWTRSSLIGALVVASLVLMIVMVWKRVCPTRQFHSLSVSQSLTSGSDYQWIAMDVLPEWIRIHQTSGAILRQSFVAILVLGALVSLGLSFTSLGWFA